MHKLIDAVLHLDLIDTYANGAYDDSHEWECECSFEGQPECECQAYDLDGRVEEEHDREMAQDYSDKLSPVVASHVLCVYDAVLELEAQGDTAEAKHLATQLRLDIDNGTVGNPFTDWTPPTAPQLISAAAKMAAEAQAKAIAAAAQRADTPAERERLARAAAFAATPRGRRLLAQRARC